MNCIKVSWDLNETALLFLVTGKSREYVDVETHHYKCPEKIILCIVVSIISVLNELKLSKEQLILSLLCHFITII